jgi:Peptidase family M28
VSASLVEGAAARLDPRAPLSPREPRDPDPAPERGVDPSREAPAPVPWIHAAGVVATVALGLLLGLWPLRPPPPLPADAPLDEFSAGRAFRHVQEIARAPHPVGSAEHAQVRDYLLGELRALGLAPEVQRATGTNEAYGAKWKGAVPAAHVENIVVRLPGTSSTRPLLLAAHYDSAPYSPGAADDGAGVAVLLETLRALRREAPLRNDLIVLLTDAEEQGLVGARAFVEQHPRGRDAGVAVNLEARGHRGPSLLFETSPGNGRLVEAFAAAAPRPAGSSLAYEIYRLLPNDTDFTVLREAGWAGLNFAFIEGFTRYHTRLDTPEALHLGSLQHQGSHALALARRFGRLDLRDLAAEDRVFFNTVVPHLVSYSQVWARTLALSVGLALAALLAIGVRRGRFGWTGILKGLLRFALLPLPLLAGLLWWLLGRLSPAREAMVLGEPYGSWRYAVGFVLLGVAFFGWVVTRLRQRHQLDEFWAGVLAGWAGLMLATTFLLPGASYLFAWPLLAAEIGFAARLLAPPRARWATPAVIASALPAVLLVAPMVHLVFVGLTLALVAAAMVLLTMLLALLTPQLDLLTARRPRLLPALAGVAGGALLLGATLTERFDADQPRPDNLFYVLDADEARASWGSTDRSPDPWTRQALTSTPRRGPFLEYLPTAPANSPLLPETLLFHDAPTVALAPPEAVLLEQAVEGEGRWLRLRLRSARGAPILSVHADAATRVLAAQVEGRPAGAGRPWGLCHWGTPAEGIEVRLRIAGAGPVRLKVLDLSYGLPAGLAAPRPASTMPTYFIGFVPDATVGVRSFVF